MVYILLGTGFEEVEAIIPVDLLRRANIEVQTVGLNGRIIKGGHGIGIETDISVDEMDVNAADMIVLPGGLGGVASIRACESAMNAIKAAWESGKFVAAICAGPTVLADLGITAGKNATCYPGCESGMGKANILENKAAVRDGKLITGTSAGCATAFGLALIEALTDRPTADKIAKQIVIR